MRILRGLSQVAIAILLASVAVIGFMFSPQVQENAHLAYLRMLMNDVVKITNSKGSGGTGFLTTTKSGKRIILTNGHVCGLAENGYVYVHYRSDVYLLKVLQVFTYHDLCAITAPLTGGKGFSIARSVDHGESVYTLGHPFLEPNTITKGELSGDVTVRIQTGENVSKEECSGEGYILIESQKLNPFLAFFGIYNICIRELDSKASSIIIHPGNSGSPDVNIYGHVVSVTFAANEAGTRSYHVPLSAVKEFLGSL